MRSRPGAALHGASTATLEVVEGTTVRVVGVLDFLTVTRLLPVGSAAIERGHVAVVDLSGVTGSDSSGLALLLEWLSVAKAAGQGLRFDHVPEQIKQLASLSDVEPLLFGG